MSRVGIVVPVFNGSGTIKKCLSSILNQNFTDYELVVVDDGSTDETCRIVNEILAKNKRGRLFRQPHKGVSAARNFGLSKLNSEWVTFVDADDYISASMLEKNIKIIDEEQNLDVVVGNMDGTSFSSKVAKKSSLIETTIDIEYGLKKYGNNYGNCRCIGGKFYRIRLIEQYKIHFPENLASFEDGIFNLYCYKYAKKIYVNSDRLYYYSENENSVSRGKSLERLKDNNETIVELKKFLNNSTLGDDAFPYCCWNLLRGSFAVISKNYKKGASRELRKRYYKNHGLFNGKIKIRYLSKKSTLVFLAARLHLFPLIALLYKI